MPDDFRDDLKGSTSFPTCYGFVQKPIWGMKEEDGNGNIFAVTTHNPGLDRLTVEKMEK